MFILYFFRRIPIFFRLSTRIIFLGFCTVTATTYYISNEGNDNADGISKTSAWKTIEQVNTITFKPGDSIQFRSGDTWREELIITSSGTVNAPIVYTSYGEGPKPAILGSNRANLWTAVEGHPNVWRSSITFSAPRQRVNHSVTNHPSSIFFGETNGTITWGNMENIHLNSEGAPTDICLCDEQGESFSLMDKEYDWCWQDNYIYIYSPSDPSSRYSFVEVPQRVSTIRTKTHPPEEHIVIDGFELLYALKYGYDDGWPMNVAVRGLTICNCHVAYMGVKGAASAIGLQIWHSDMLIQNNDIHDCGRRNISYNVYGDVRSKSITFENVIFENNKLHNGYHTTGFDISCGYTDTFKNFVFRNNYIWDNPADDPTKVPNDFTSLGMFINADRAVFTDFKIYNNVLRYTKQKGIAINGLKNSFISNNTFYGMNVLAGGSGYRAMINVAGNVSELSIENNIFYGNVAEQYVLSCVTFSGMTHTGSTMNNNIYFQENSSQRMVTINVGSSYRMSNWENYKLHTGWDLSSPVPANPQFVNAPQNLSLSAQSPAVSAAKPISWITTDFIGNQRDSQHPSIGAYEFTENSSIRASFKMKTENTPVTITAKTSGGIVHISTVLPKTFKCVISTIQGKIVQNTTFNKSLHLTFKPGLYIVYIKGYDVSYIQEVIVVN